MGLLGLVFAFSVGLAVTLWLARREALQSTAPRLTGKSRTNLLGYLAVFSAIVGVGLVAFAAYSFTRPASRERAALAPEATPESASPAGPTRLIIPALGLEEKIYPLPLKDGLWDVASLGDRVGRLEGAGQHPNDTLALVLTAHVSLPPSARGPFADLWTIKTAAEVIYRWGGKDYVYAVSDSTSIQPQEVEKLYVNDGQSLLLVTCTDWDYVKETYQSRLLVRAILVETRDAPTALP